MKFLVCVHFLVACFRDWFVFDFANDISVFLVYLFIQLSSRLNLRMARLLGNLMV